PLDLPEAAIALHAPGIIRDLPDGLDIGRDPSEAMGRALLALERRAIDLAAGRDLGGNRLDRAVAQRSRGLGGGLKQWNELRRARCLAPRQRLCGSQFVLLMRNLDFHRSVLRAPSQIGIV